VSSTILFLCRANLCRSPAAEVMLTRALAAADVDATVISAGMEVEEGQVAPEDFMELALLRGIDLRDHHQMVFTPDLGEDADLLLTMTRDLLRGMVVETPALWPRSFTLLELVRRGVADEPPRLGDTLGSWIARVHGSRDRAELLGNDPVDDIRDPQADAAEGNEVMFGQLERSTRRLARLMSSLSG
jgi:protein-tyrosine phosphatase